MSRLFTMTLLYRLSEFTVGVLFGLGLILSGMTDPRKVLGFLDLAGDWDPSLALVMGGAIAVGVLAFALARRRGSSLLGSPLHLPGNTRLDRRLILGSLTFGVGWGLAGLCPGPAIAALAIQPAPALLFIAAMALGAAIHCFALTPRRSA